MATTTAAAAAAAAANTYRPPPRTSSLNPPLSPGITPARQAQLNSSAPYSHHAEDPLVFEIGSRLLRAGFAGEAAPRCVLEWSSEAFWRREGGVWAGAGEKGGGGEGARGELWRADLRGVELGVVEDVVERGVRMAYNKYLLLDSKLKRLLLVLPPHLPTPLTTALLKTLFVHFQMPGIMLLSSPTMATLAAGTRSALVLDIGWEEATASTIYELRPVGRPHHTRRAGLLLRTFWRPLLPPKHRPRPRDRDIDNLISRLSWCRPASASASDTNTTPTLLPLPHGAPVTLPFQALSEPAEQCFFAPTTAPGPPDARPDDDDRPLPRLVYDALRAAPVDVRAACMARIVVVGGGSQVLGLKRRVVDEVRGIVEREGWGRGGAAVPPPPPPPPEVHEEEGQVVEVGYGWTGHREVAISPGSPRGGLERRGPAPQGTPRVRGVESLGAWVGGSLVAGMKARGTVEVEREKFLAAVAAGGSGLPLGF